MTIDAASSNASLILRGTPETLSMSWYANGEIADPGATTIGIVNAAGTVVVASGTATTGTGAAARTYNLPSSETADLDILTVTWTTANYGVRSQYIEVAGEQLYTIAQARAFSFSKLDDDEKYLQLWIEDGRRWILDMLYERCGVSFVPRYRRVTLDGSGARGLLLPDIKVVAVRSIEYRERGSTTWTAFTADELADALPGPYSIERESLGYFTRGRANWRVGYEHGFLVPPGEVVNAALALLVDALVESNFSNRATNEVSALGTFTIATAGMKPNPWSAYRYTGLPDVDAVIAAYEKYRMPGFA